MRIAHNRSSEFHIPILGAEVMLYGVSERRTFVPQSSTPCLLEAVTIQRLCHHENVKVRDTRETSLLGFFHLDIDTFMSLLHPVNIYK